MDPYEQDLNGVDTMPYKAVYNVIPNVDSGWRLEPETVDDKAAVFKTKEEALRHARELARKHSVAQIRVHRADGTVHSEYTYRRDPYPSGINPLTGLNRNPATH